MKRPAHQFRKPRRDRMRGDITKALAVIDIQATVRRAAERVRFLQDCVEHRREVAGRAVDDPQYLGGRGLLLKRFGKFCLTLGKLTFEIGYPLIGSG
jgi:hypothetical protein